MTDFLSLAERVEAATGPDRALDTAIAVAIDYRWPEWEEGDLLVSAMAAKHGLEWAVQRVATSGTSIWRNLPRYTSSLDAAMTLVPENYTVMLHFSGCAHFRPEVKLWLHGTVNGPGDVEAEAATPALALTAACLRARATQETK